MRFHPRSGHYTRMRHSRCKVRDVSATAVIAPVYPALAAKTLETLAKSLTLMERNNRKNPNLADELGRAAATACAEHGVTGDDHVKAVTDLAADIIMRHMPAKHLDVAEIPGAANNKHELAAARREYTINLFGYAPLRLLSAFMLQFAAEASPESDRRA